MATHNHDLLRKYPLSSTKMWDGELLDSKTHDVSFGTSFLKLFFQIKHDLRNSFCFIQ